MARLDLTPTVSQMDQNEPTGWVDRTQTTLAYNPSTRTVTLTAGPSGATFYSDARRFILAPDEVKTATHNNTTGIHFFYFDGSTTFQAQPTPWTIDGAQVPVTAIYYNADTADGVYLEERHGIQMDGKTHRYLHFTQGTKVESGFDAYGFTLNPVSPINSDNLFSVETGAIDDEDLRSVVPALVGGTNAYRVWYRSGANGDWQWDTASTPFTVGTYAQYNQFTGSTWQKADLTSDQWINYWVAATPTLTPNHGIIMIMGQQTFGDLPNALAEDLHDIDFGTLPFTEFAALYRVTVRTNSAYTTTGKARLEDVTKIIGQNIISTLGHNVTQHSDLTGRDGADAHPASSITVDTTNFSGELSGLATTVQAALELLDDHIHPGGTVLSDTPPASPTTGDIWYETDTGKYFVYYDSFWVEIGTALSGPQGPQGNTGTISVGTVDTVTFAEGASVVNSGTSTAAVFDFEIPAGPQGEPGTSITILGTLNNISELPSTGNTAGDSYIIDGDLYVWDGAAWQNVGQIVGPQGPQGPQGNSVAVFNRADAVTVTTGKARYRFAVPATILGVTAAVDTASTSGSIIVDVNKNGTTVFTTQANRPTIAQGSNESHTGSNESVPDVTSIAAGDYLTVDIDSAGTNASDLTIFVRYAAV